MQESLFDVSSISKTSLGLDDISLISNKEESKSQGNEVLLNVLLDTCINCNQVETAINLFESLDASSFFKPDEVTFNTLIKGCSIERKLEKALALFKQMKDQFNLVPNDVTYNSLIDVCIRCNN
jgi:pentatricopeptide repeat protein